MHPTHISYAILYGDIMTRVWDGWDVETKGVPMKTELRRAFAEAEEAHANALAVLRTHGPGPLYEAAADEADLASNRLEWLADDHVNRNKNDAEHRRTYDAAGEHATG